VEFSGRDWGGESSATGAARCHNATKEVVIERTASERARLRRLKEKCILYSAAKAEMVSVEQHVDKSMRCSSSLSGSTKGTHPQDAKPPRWLHHEQTQTRSRALQQVQDYSVIEKDVRRMASGLRNYCARRAAMKAASTKATRKWE